MRFLTNEQCEGWFKGRGIVLPGREPSQAFERIKIDDWHPFATAQWMADALTYRDEVLLWITEWKIWPSRENWHLYYTLRQLTGDYGLLSQTPGHFFLPHEMEELKTMPKISLLNGWGEYFLAAGGGTNALFSHDGYIDFHASDDEQPTPVRERFEAA